MKTYKSQAGYSLIEVMIASAIGLFLIGGLMQMFITSKKVYALQSAVSRLQENNRFAMGFLSHDLRSLGAWGCFNDTSSGRGIENLLNTPSDFDGFRTGVSGTNNDGLNGSDTISLNSSSTVLDTSGAEVVLNMKPTGAALHISPNSVGIDKGDIVVVGDCEYASLIQITNFNLKTSGNSILTHNTGAGTEPGNDKFNFSKPYQEEVTKIYKARFVTYSIQMGERGQPSLFRQENGGDSAELIEGVQNMQILYGEDTDNNGTPDYYVTADLVSDMTQVVSIKVSLLLLTIEDNLTSSPIAYNFNGLTTTPPIGDSKIRRASSQIITIRNRLF